MSIADVPDWTYEVVDISTLVDPLSDLTDWTLAVSGSGGGSSGGGGPIVLMSDSSASSITGSGPPTYYTSQACPAPAGMVAGNTLVAIVTGSGFSGTFGAPGGWSAIGSGWPGTGQIAGFAVFTHTVGISEPGSYTFTYSNAVRAPAVMILQYSGPHTASGVIIQGGSLSLLSSATAAAQTTTLAPATVLSVYNSYQGNTWSTPAGTALRLNITNAGELGFTVFEEAAAAINTYGPFVSTTSPATQWSTLSFQLA